MFKKINGILIFSIIMAFFMAGNLSAQNAQELRFGSRVQGNLSEGAELWYSIRHTTDSFVVVETFGELDTYLEVYDSSREFIAENDDGGDDYNARIEMFIRAGITYFFKLRGYDDYESGPYAIMASLLPLPQPTELRFGNQVQGNLRAGESQWYSVRSDESAFVIVETFGNTDTYMEVYDVQYNLLMEDDDSGSGYNARIELHAEPTQTYLFRVRGYSSSETGAYRIMASYEPVLPDTELNTERSRAVTLRLGEAFPVFIRTQNESRWYRYEVTRESANFFVQTRGNIDTLLYLYDSSGNLIAEDDDSGEGGNALINERLNAGTYFIEVKTYSGVAGRCTLHAETR